MEKISGRIRKLEDSQTMAMNQKSRDLQSRGIDVINLSVGEPDYNTPPHVKEAAKSAIDNNASFYSPVNGFPDLLNSISKKFLNENDLNYSPQNIIVSNGAKHSIANALTVLIDDGDEVIVPAPYWVSYVELVKLAGGTNVIIQTDLDSDFKVTPEQIEAAITNNTKAILLCSPNNPTGTVYTKQELKEIAEVIKKHPEIFVISDEIYEHINFVGKHESIAQFDDIRDRVIVVNGVSKAYAMTGWRIGYLAGPAWIVKACSKLQGQFTSGACSIAQKAAVAALSGDNSYTEAMNKAFSRRRNLVVKRINSIDGMRVSVPGGAFYVFPEVKSYIGKSFNGKMITNDTDFCMFLLEEAHVAAVPGEAFGSPNHIRISYATSDDKLSEAFDRIEKAVALLQ